MIGVIGLLVVQHRLDPRPKVPPNVRVPVRLLPSARQRVLSHLWMPTERGGGDSPLDLVKLSPEGQEALPGRHR